MPKRVGQSGLAKADCQSDLVGASRCPRSRRIKGKPINPDDLRQGFECIHETVIGFTVDFNKADRFPARFPTAEMEGGDVDTALPAEGTKITDKAGLVVIADIEQPGGKIALNRDCLLYTSDAADE